MQKIFKTKLHQYFVCIAMSVFIFFTLFQRIFVDHKCNAPLPCHCSETGDALLPTEDPSFSPKAESIFFHETSCLGGLTVREACAVEAAARAHPKREIFVLFSAPVTHNKLRTGCLADLLKFPNIKFLRVHLAEYSNGTAVQSLLLNEVEESKYKIHHAADVLRLLTLSKWGGIYLDTDMIVARSLDDLPPNFVARQDTEEFASGILSIGKDEIGTSFTNEILELISKNYYPNYWTLGADALEAVLRRMCPKLRNSTAYLKNLVNCKGVVIFNYHLFYPVHYTDIDIVFNPPSEKNKLCCPYTYHMWNYLSFNKTIRRGTVYDLVAEAFCPTIYSKYNYEFRFGLNF